MVEDCGRRFHIRCIGLIRENAAKYGAGILNWNCDCSIKSQENNDLHTVFSEELPEGTKANPEATDVRKSLRILQWNCEGLNPKVHELQEKAKALDIDAIFIQESKLSEKQNEPPKIGGYSVIRVDRKKTIRVEDSSPT